jgi:hypothetical protein
MKEAASQGKAGHKSARKPIMTHRTKAISLLVASLIVAAAANVAVADKKSSSKETGPVPDAKSSEKPAKTYDLRYKLKRGDVLRYEVSHRASIRSTIEQQTQAAQTRTDSVKAWKVTDVLKHGEIEFISVVERVRMVNQLPEKDPIEYDSERDKTPPPGFEDAARNVGVPLSAVRISPRGKIEKREVKARGTSDEDDAPIALRLPDAPIAIGDTWDEQFEVKVELEGGGTKAVQTRRHHELLNVVTGIATIKVTYQVLSPIDARIECQLVQRLMEGEVKFDIEKGRVVGQQMDIDRRILGFAGPTSSMQYIMRMDERLLKKGEKAAFTTANNSTKKDSSDKARTAKRQRTQQGKRSIRR